MAVVKRRMIDFESDLEAIIGPCSVRPRAFVYIGRCRVGCKVGVTDNVLRRMNRLIRSYDELVVTHITFLRLYRRQGALDVEDAARPLLAKQRHSRGLHQSRTDYYACDTADAEEAIIQAEREIHAWPLAEYSFSPLPLWEPNPYMKPRPVPPREPIEFVCI